MTYPNSQWTAEDFGKKPSAKDQKLLSKWAPEFWISKKSCGPMDFYQQFVPKLQTDRKGKAVVTKAFLKEFERDLTLKWKLKDPPDCLESANPPLYSQVFSEKWTVSGKSYDLKVLKYSFSFYKSGLPEYFGPLSSALSLFVDTTLWHYLDLHGATFVLLVGGKPVSLVLAQHNHFRSYVIGLDVSAPSSTKICFSNYSNEPYLCDKLPKSLKLPTAANMKSMEWIVSERSSPTIPAWDGFASVQERQKINYKLNFLTTRDPIITSWNRLGPGLKILGLFPSFYRKAPPGMAIFNTPALKELHKTAEYFYFDPKNKKLFQAHAQGFKDFMNPDIDEVLKQNSKRMHKNLVKSHPDIFN